jgi:hypothetical protein
MLLILISTYKIDTINLSFNAFTITKVWSIVSLELSFEVITNQQKPVTKQHC